MWLFFGEGILPERTHAPFMILLFFLFIVR